MDVCTTCDGSGLYAPQFSAAVLVECQECNADGHKSAFEFEEPDPAPADRAPGGGR